ncbi:MAG: carboxypeptidase regulatory-like domain-containing protein [Bryobacteraceae bacterium]
MTEHLHPGPHLDPELLNAFVEGVLPEHERLQCLSHFAACSRCREIVFLAQEPVPAPAPVPSDAKPWWRGWFWPIPVLGSALAACALLYIALSLYRPEIPVGSPATVVAALKDRQADTTPAATTVYEPAQEASSTSVKAKIIAPPAPRAAQSAAAVPLGALGNNSAVPSSTNGPPSTFAQVGVEPPPAPAPTALKPAADTAQNQPVPLAQSTASARAQRLVPKAEATLVATSAAAASAGGSSLKLSVEHDRSTVNGLSEVKGTVMDVAGSAVAGATVTIRQLAGSAGGTTVTGRDGQFAMTALPAGRYELQIESPGFQKVFTPLELQPQDLATVASSLSVDSVSETVEVRASSPALEYAPRAAQVSAREAHPLPSKLPIVSSAASGMWVLATDSAGALFYSKNAGKQWKMVKPQWQGKVARVVVSYEPKVAQNPNSQGKSAAALPAASAVRPMVFQLITDNGSVWFSQDGAHWYPQLPRP